ncbi:DNA-binding response regulator [Parashewanella spongiae]|uniref:DNA-binding response regulator n=1 Tax=Parashewanella spongiae TaxID=342950 RepID=A0A3A6TQS5_9GAMM|nr:response regulator transcription factor [Parashewanella spongiae]MCL1079622.1 response regulator transcription factor [Parashewanella spongiae]RJY07198.1 DNA-binding response regulator [Parashewanella spongiae]
MKFLLVDDHWLFLDGLANVLTIQNPKLEVLKAGSVDDALKMLDEHSGIDLILVDLAMPTTDGLSLLNSLSTQNYLIPAVVLSASEDLTQISKAMRLGASGFIPKTYGTKYLSVAIDRVLAGEIFLPENMQNELDMICTEAQTKNEIAHQFQITPRQLEVISMLKKGYSNGKIADLLFISEHTVKSHLKQIFQKLDCETRLACISKAQSLELIN